MTVRFRAGIWLGTKTKAKNQKIYHEEVIFNLSQSSVTIGALSLIFLIPVLYQSFNRKVVYNDAKEMIV